MPVFLTKDIAFPPIDEADENGIIAIGGDLSAPRLLAAYRLGIFPWPHEKLPLLWFCPDPRFVLEPHALIVNQSLRKIVRNTSLVLKADTDFLSVIKKCAATKRYLHEGTWITDKMIDGFYELHKMGFAHSIEGYDQNTLVGGLYGVSLGAIFYGESMFFEKSNASKICFVHLVAHLCEWGFSLIDCQAYTPHLEKLGARFIKRGRFLDVLKTNAQMPTKMGPWQLYLSNSQVLKHFRT